MQLEEKEADMEKDLNNRQKQIEIEKTTLIQMKENVVDKGKDQVDKANKKIKEKEEGIKKEKKA